MTSPSEASMDDRARYKALREEKETILRDMRAWLTQEGIPLDHRWDDETEKRLDGAFSSPGHRLDVIDREMWRLHAQFAEGRRSGNSLRSQFYTLKDSLFGDIRDRPEVVRVISKSKCPEVSALHRLMQDLDAEPDDQTLYDRAVELVRDIHAFVEASGLISSGQEHVSKP